LVNVTRNPQCMFTWYTQNDDRRHFKSFAVGKYGEYGALFRAEEVRRRIFPDWGNDEDIYSDDLGHIEWD
jgi:hypothetical protein